MDSQPASGRELRPGDNAVTPRLRRRVKVLRVYIDQRENPPRRVAVVRFRDSGDVLHVWADDLEVIGRGPEPR